MLSEEMHQKVEKMNQNNLEKEEEKQEKTELILNNEVSKKYVLTFDSESIKKGTLSLSISNTTVENLNGREFEGLFRLGNI